VRDLHRFRGTVHRESLAQEAHRVVDAILVDADRGEPFEGGAGAIAVVGPDVAQPVVELVLDRSHAVEERATVEVERAFELGRVLRFDAAPELGEIDVALAAESERVVTGLEQPVVHTADPRQRLPQVVARALFEMLAPEQRRQLLPRVGPAMLDREVGQERPVLLSG